jgi:hypothetical protein
MSIEKHFALTNNNFFLSRTQNCNNIGGSSRAAIRKRKVKKSSHAFQLMHCTLTASSIFFAPTAI